MSTLPPRKRKKKTKNQYFTQATEDAIVRYNNCSDFEERSEIYRKDIHYAFFKLTENIIHTFKFYYTEVDDIEHLQHEVITFLLSKIHLFDPTRGAKAFSYFGTIAKRYLIIQNTKNYKKRVDKAPVDELYHNFIELKNKDHNKEIYEIKVQLGKEISKWKKRGNAYSRWNPNGLEFEPCILPLDFDIDNIEVTQVKDKEGKLYFNYPIDKEKSERKNHWIYIELYDLLKEKPRELKQKEILEQKEIKDLKIETIKNWEDMKEHLINKGVSPKGYMKKMGLFLLNLKGDTFTIEDIDEAIGFNNRKTRRDYIKKFIDLDLIEGTKIKRVYRKKF